MGIGISYTSADGTKHTFDAKGAAGAIAELTRIQGASPSVAPRKRETGGGSTTNDINLKNFIGIDSALEVKSGKLRLKSELEAVIGSVFAKDSTGKKRFVPLDEFLNSLDKRVDGERIGDAFSSDDDMQLIKRDGVKNDPFSVQLVTRIFAVQRPKEKGSTAPTETPPMHKILVAGIRECFFTGEGRLYKIGEEMIMDVCPLSEGGGGGGTTIRGGGCFDPLINDSGLVTLGNCYYRIGGKTYVYSGSTTFTPSAGKIYALKIAIYEATPSASIVSYSSVSAMQSDERDPDYYIAPLYEFEADPEDASRCVIKCDFRISPDAALGEFSS